MPAPLAHILNPMDVSPHHATLRSVHPEGQEMSDAAASLVSYKRVPKACTQCRRDKSRCDRVRPCNGCVRKGRIDSCVVGCVACRRARLSCDGSRPCSSCAHDGIECIEDDPGLLAASRKKQKKPVSTSPLHRRIKPHPRVSIPTPQTHKLGCVACQRDNQRCTGGMTCRRCTELEEQCIYVFRPPKLFKQRCALCRKKNKKCELVRPCVHCVRADVPCIDLPRKGVGRGLRVKRACAGCRADKIQCEEARPCGGCKKKSIECVERSCNACLASEGGKCASCTRQDHFDHEECETSSTASYSEDDDNISGLFPSSPASPLSCTVSLADAPCTAKPPTASSSPIDLLESRYGPAVMLNNGLDPPHRIPSFDRFEPYNMRQNHLSAHTYILPSDVSSRSLTHMAELPPFSVGFSSLSLSASTNHMRTRPNSDVSEEYVSVLS